MSVLTDLGPGQRETETLPDWTHQHGAWCGRQQSEPLPVLLRRGQAGQVLGSGVQQGKSWCERSAVIDPVLDFYCCGFDFLDLINKYACSQFSLLKI